MLVYGPRQTRCSQKAVREPAEGRREAHGPGIHIPQVEAEPAAVQFENPGVVGLKGQAQLGVEARAAAKTRMGLLRE